MEQLFKKYRKNLNEIEKFRRVKRLKRIRELEAENRIIRRILSEYINEIDDPVISLILRERFLRGKSWQSVALSLGGGNSADGVRMKIKRHFRRY